MSGAHDDPTAPRALSTDEQLSELRSRRSQLKEGMTRLESAVARPVAGDASAWADEVGEALARLREDFAVHITVTEREGGFHDQLVHDAPRLEGKVRRLTREHETLRHDIDEAQEAWVQLVSEGTAGGDEGVDEVRRRVTDLLGRLSRHRQRGSDLVWEAFAFDLGGET